MEEVISLEDTQRFTAALEKHVGVDLRDYAHFSLQRRLSRYIKLNKFASLDDLMEHLASGIDREALIKEFTVNTTEMFRDPDFWVVLRDHVLPAIADRKTIRVWHAGCSSGQELYSMIIMLHESKLLERAKFFATDIDLEVLQNTKEGMVPGRTMETNIENYKVFHPDGDLMSYFQADGENYVLRESLMENVMVRKHDLVKEPEFSRFDIIMCRNVLIYFNQHLQNRVVETFRSSLFRNSYLAIGSKESLAWCKSSSRFEPVYKDEKIYKLR